MAFLAQLAANTARWERILSGDAAEFICPSCQTVTNRGAPSDRDFTAAAREVWDRHKGRPAQAVDVTSGGAPLTIRIVRDDPDPE